MKFRNKKTNEVYRHRGHCINATNSANNDLMIMYESASGDMYVREADEFNEKFEVVKKCACCKREAVLNDNNLCTRCDNAY